MKSYIKPSIKYIELRAEESLAGFGSFTSITGNHKYSISEQIFSEDFVHFWLKILRR